MRKKILFFAGLAALLVSLGFLLVRGNTALELNAYTVTSPRLPASFDGYRIAHISDLHNTQMGKSNKNLLAMLRQAAPDLIVITGDLVDSRNTKIHIALDFVREAVKIAPCYYVPGNHESRIEAYADMKTQMDAAGVTILDDTSVEITIDGEPITMMGVVDPCFQTDDLSSDNQTIMRAKLTALQESRNGFTILLSHRPELFEIYTAYDLDLVFSGHAHGGQIRLPFVGGMLAPDQGWFPELDAGIHTAGNTHLVVSRGIGNSLFPFRINNPPEVVLVELHRTLPSE